MDGSTLIGIGVHRVVYDDIPWMMSLAYERYGPYDPGGALLFLLQGLKSESTVMLRSYRKDAFLIASWIAAPWWPNKRECHLVFLCARTGAHWQAVKLLRESIVWARLQGCTRWRFHSDTENDIGALCRLLKAREDSPRYVIDL